MSCSPDWARTVCDLADGTFETLLQAGGGTEFFYLNRP